MMLHIYTCMEYIYVFVPDGADWDDIVLFLSKEEAIETSKKYPKVRLELFRASPKGGYIPTYSYYLDGVYVQTTESV